MPTPPAIPNSPLQSCLPHQSWLRGLAEGLAAWLCGQKGGYYLAVVLVDTCLLRGMREPYTVLAERQWDDASALLSLAFSFSVTWARGITQ